MMMIKITWFVGVLGIWLGYFYINDQRELKLSGTIFSFVVTSLLYYLAMKFFEFTYTIGGH